MKEARMISRFPGVFTLWEEAKFSEYPDISWGSFSDRKMNSLSVMTSREVLLQF